MACRICSCVFDGIRFIKLPNVYNWESLINAIDCRIMLDITFFRDICIGCYQKLERFFDFRQLHLLNVKCEPEYNSSCTICKIILSNGIVFAEEEWLPQRRCIRILFPDMLYKDDDTMYLCQHCLGILLEFCQFWQLVLTNIKPLPIQTNLQGDIPTQHGCAIYKSVKMNSPIIQIKTEQLDIKTKEEDIYCEPEDNGESQESQMNEEILSLKFTFNTVCQSIRDEDQILLKFENSDYKITSVGHPCCTIESYKTNIEEGMGTLVKEDTHDVQFNTNTNNKYIEQVRKQTFYGSQKIEDNNGNWEDSKEQICALHIEESTICDQTEAIRAVPTGTTNITLRPSLNVCNDHAGKYTKDEIIASKIVEEKCNYQQNMQPTSEDHKFDDDGEHSLKVEEHEPYENEHKNYRVRSKKTEDINKIPYLCVYCSTRFNKLEELLKHLREDHRSQPVKHQCPSCQFTTSRRKYLTRHYYYNHKEDFVLHSCPLCKFQTKRSGHLKAHLNKHYGSVMHKCNLCDFTTKWPYSLKCHVIAKHDTTSELIHCTKCDYRTKFTNELNKHMKYKHNKADKFLNCPKCSFKSHFQAWLNKHVKYQHPDVEELYKCHLCNFQSRLYSSLRTHKKMMHSEDKTVYYKCKQCDHKTKYKGNLKIHHMLKHEEKAEMVRCARCSFQTRLKGDLSKHLRYRHGDLPRLSCPHCPHTTLRKSHLAEHVKRQHGDDQEMYKCDKCDHRTKYVGNLRQHQRLRHEKVPELHSCGLCKHKTKYKNNLKGHYKVCHGL